MASAPGDSGFGPHLEGHFDFTLLFEQSILSILPSGIFIGAACYRLVSLRHARIVAMACTTLWLKLACSIALVGIQAALVVLWSTKTASTAPHGVSVAASVVSLVAALLTGQLAYFEHVRSVRPAMVLSGYLFLSVLLDLAQARSLWLRPGLDALAGVFAASLGLRSALVVLEETPKAYLPAEKPKSAGPESTSGLVNRSVFWWLNSMFKQGYRALIRPADLAPLQEKLASETLLPSVQRRWLQADKSSKHALMKATLLSLRLQLAAAVLPRLAFAGFQFAQPFLINRIIKFVSEAPTEFDQGIIGGLIGATALVYGGIAITRCAYKHLTYQLLTMIRGGLISLIFQKMLELDPGASSDAAAVTLMSTDIDSIAQGFQYIHDLWGNVVQVAVGLYLLQTQLGYSGFLVVVPAFVSSVSVRFVGKGMGPARVAWNQGVQRRIAATSSMLAHIKSIKMMGLADHVRQSIQDFRVAEVDLSKKYRGFLVWLNVVANGCDLVAPVFVIIAAVFLTTRRAGLSVAEVFTALSIMVVVSQPLAELLSSSPMVMASIACFGRIQAFLLLEERTDYRLALGEHRRSPASSASLDNDVEMALSLLPGRADHDAPIIEIEEASFRTRDGVELLHDISMRVPRSSLSIVVGRIGCGKSTLLKAILGEVPAALGSVAVRTRSVAYCDQTPWLMNKSIRENIVGTLPFEEARYRRAVYVCALDQDFSVLPGGDGSLVGSGGSRMSGGQRQRVALARAVYAQRELLLLDDVFSGLDNTTSNTVFSRLLGPNGLLRQTGATAVLATHAVKFLPYADFVTVLDVGGITTNQSAYDDLDEAMKGTEASGSAASPARGDGADPAEPETDRAVAPTTPEAPAVSAPDAADADLARQTGDFDLYKFYFQSVGAAMCIIVLGLSTLFIFSSKLPQIWVRIWTAHGTTTDRDFYVGIYALLAAVPCIAIYLTVWYYMLRVMPKSAQYLHWMLLEAVLAAPLYFFTTTDSGTTLNRFSQDMTLVDQVLPVAFFTTIFDVLIVVAEAALIASGGTYVAAVIPFCIAALYALQKFYLRTSRQVRYLDLEAKSPLYTHFTETLAGLVTIRAFGWRAAFARASSALLDQSQKPYYLLYCIQRWLNVVLDLFVTGLALALVSLSVSLRGSTSGGAIGLAMLNIISFNTSLSNLIISWTNLETSLGAIARLRSFLAETPREAREAERQDPPPGWPTAGAVEFRNVTSGYSPTTPPVLRDVSLAIRPGQKVAICGRTGSGKSSLVLTLLRLLDLRDGSLRVDGVDLSLLPRQAVRSLLTTLPQDPVRLAGSVRANLDPHRRAPGDADLVAALARTGLWPAVEARGGLAADMDDLGLSVGQQQLFCLSRAILHRTRVLLLDEATSSVDRETDEAVRRVVAEEFAECTVIEVAHRLDAVVGYDLVVVMQEGRVAEMGNPKELLQGETRFRALWDSQKG